MTATPLWLRRLATAATAAVAVARRHRIATAAALLLVAASGAYVLGAHVRGASRGDGGQAVPAGVVRSGWDEAEPDLSPAVVRDGGFGPLFTARLDGAVLGQPVTAGRTLVVATEADQVYGLDPVTGKVRWSRSLGRPVPNARVVCGVLGPTSGVTSTPVYDPRTGRVYVMAEVAGGAQPQFWLYAIAARTGAVDWRVAVRGAPSNDPSRPFRPAGELQRPALVLTRGWVYAAFGPRCEGSIPYGGYVVGVDTTTRALTMWSDGTGTLDGQAGIWQAGRGPLPDEQGRGIIVATANGVPPAPGDGSAPPGRLGDSVVRLEAGPGGRLVARDFFSPTYAPELETYDLDIGSAGPIALPFGTTRYPRLLAHGGKDGVLLLLNRDHLGGRRAGAVVARAGPFGGLFGRPAAFHGRGGADYVYYTGQSDYLRALRFDGSRPSRPVLTDVAAGTSTFGPSSGPPVVTSDGDDPRSAVVWEINDNNQSGVLEAYEAIPRRDGGVLRMHRIWSAPIGVASHFSTPLTADGRVYVGTQLGTVLGFGRPGKAPLSAPPVGFGQVADGAARTATVTVTARSSVTVLGISARSGAGGDQFVPGTPRRNGVPAEPPVTLSRGQRLTVPVTFRPAVPGEIAGTVSLTTDSQEFPEVGVEVSGTGTRPGLYAAPVSVRFPRTVPGIPTTAIVHLANSGTTGAAVSSVTRPGGPFQVTGLPAPGTVLRPGESRTVRVTYAPDAASRDDSSFFRVTTGGAPLTVSVSGTASGGDAKLTATPASLNFGRVPLGRSATRVIDVFDPGQQPVVITGVSRLGPPFRTATPIVAGQSLGPTNGIEVPVTFTPERAGRSGTDYLIRFRPVGRGRPGSVLVRVTGTGQAP